MDRLEYYMYNFNIIELKQYLGTDLADLLVEWLPEGEQIYSEENLINMIRSVYGNKILENPSFRTRLYKAFEPEKILEYRVLLPGHENDDVAVVIEAMSNSTWGKNALSYKVLDDLGIDHAYFEKAEDTRASIESIAAYDRFFELLDYQFIIKQKILTYVNSDNDLPKMLVRMPTGTGKTKTAMHTIINQYVFKQNGEGLVVWIAHTKELLDQAFDTFCNVWHHIGQGNVKTYKLWDRYDVNEAELDNGFMFIGIQKLTSLMNNNPDLFSTITNKAHIVIVDEAHRASAKETKKAIDRLMAYVGFSKALIGLTATPGRTGDTETALFQAMFDNKIIDIDTSILNQLNLSKVEADNTTPEKDIIKYFQKRGILSKLKRTPLQYGDLTKDEISKLKVHMTSNGYRDVTEAFLRIIAMNKKRNAVIVNKLIDLNNMHKPTIVFACSVEHGKMLSAALTMQGIKNGHVFGDMDPVERRNFISRFKDKDDDLNILINYEVLTTGFDATNIQCVFITRPTNSVVLYSQMLGRGLRGPQMGGNEYCELIDIEDNLERFTNESQAFNYFSEYWN
ncbi:DEAD/DEAH box helicase, partial [Lachnospira multipara]|uniref:DEAD/DEAH box helicase n=1 Tax=Lachnospira multipara TaxID=28051 RepID=UPI0004E1FD7A